MSLNSNERWADVLIETLVQQGAKHFWISPGSRVTPLILALEKHPQVHLNVHFDERALGFHALGHAKATQLPSVIVVTSGTAVANLFPAIMEASLTHTPLILLTSDRPSELRDCGANQTVDQVNCFGSYMRWMHDLAAPTQEIPIDYVISSGTQAYLTSLYPNPGPVQLNCMFREPLFSPSVSLTQALPRFSLADRPELIPSHETIMQIARQLQDVKKGVIIVGEQHSTYSSEWLFVLAETLKWPIITDVLANVRTQHTSVIPHYESLLKNHPEWREEVELILWIGERLVSKTLLEWMAKDSNTAVVQFIPYSERQDPKHIVQRRVIADPFLTCQHLVPYLKPSLEAEWLDRWVIAADCVSETLDNYFSTQTTISEPLMIHWLKKNCTDKFALFIANSMPIRDADKFLFFNHDCPIVFGNRGTSGIDGNLATSIGIAKGLNRPLITVLGDLATLHDLTSFTLLKECPVPLLIIIINNGGGGIFSFLPIANKSVQFEKLVAYSHEFSFASIAAFFELPYEQPTTQEELDALWLNWMKKRTSCVVEILTDRKENVEVHRHVEELIQKTLCSPAAHGA